MELDEQHIVNVMRAHKRELQCYERELERML